MLTAKIIATLVPLACLVVICFLGRGGLKTTPLIVIALLWGVASTFLVLPFNDRWYAKRGLQSLIIYGAPFAEEICKALILPFLTLSKRCFWFVDGAILGLAAGTGFAIRENWIYLDRDYSGQQIGLAIARVSSTNLMHAGTTAIVGAAIVLSMKRGLLQRVFTPVVGLGIAITLHSTFNRMTTWPGESAAAITAVGVGVFAIASGIVALGFPISRRWVRNDLKLSSMTQSEQLALSGGHTIDALLDEFELRYGSAAVKNAEELIKVQRQISIAQHGGHINAKDAELLEKRADNLRREIGLFAMMWLRTHLPVDPSSAGLWGSLPAPSDGDAQVGGLSGLSIEDIDNPNVRQSAPGGMWARLGDDSDGDDSDGDD